jgi:uncharacterized membrane protein
MNPTPLESNLPAARTDRWMSILLRTASAISVALIVFGMAVSLWRHPQYLTTRAPLAELVSTKAEFPHTVAAVAGGIAAGRGQALVALGLLVLIATPIARVALSIAGFLELRDWTFAMISAIVLTILLVSLLLGTVEASSATTNPNPRPQQRASAG